MILDQPTAALSVQEQKVLELAMSLAKQNVAAVIYGTHNMDDENEAQVAAIRAGKGVRSASRIPLDA